MCPQDNLGPAALVEMEVLNLPSPGTSLPFLMPHSYPQIALFTPEASGDPLQPLQKTKLNGFSWAPDYCPRSAYPYISSEGVPAGGSGFGLGDSADIFPSSLLL